MIEHPMTVFCLIISAVKDVKGVVNESHLFHAYAIKLWDAVICVNNIINETVALTLMMRNFC